MMLSLSSESLSDTELALESIFKSLLSHKLSLSLESIYSSKSISLLNYSFYSSCVFEFTGTVSVFFLFKIYYIRLRYGSLTLRLNKRSSGNNIPSNFSTNWRSWCFLIIPWSVYFYNVNNFCDFYINFSLLKLILNAYGSYLPKTLYLFFLTYFSKQFEHKSYLHVTHLRYSSFGLLESAIGVLHSLQLN